MTTDTQRDPRTQPVAGDVLSAVGGRVPEIRVTGSDRNAVSWTSAGIPDACSDIASWQRWAKTATIIRRGDQP